MDAVLAVLLSDMADVQSESGSSAAQDASTAGAQGLVKKTPSRGPLQPVGNTVPAPASPSQPSLATQVRMHYIACSGPRTALAQLRPSLYRHSIALQAAERELKAAQADVKEHKAHISALESDLEQARSKAHGLEAKLRQQQSDVRELCSLRQQLAATTTQAEEWQRKLSCAALLHMKRTAAMR